MKQFFSWAFGFALLSGILVSCDEPGSIGSNLLPSEDNLTTIQADTFQVKSWSYRQEETVTSGLDANLLGSLDDPLFGKSSASLFAEFRLPGDGNNNINFGDTAFFDSLVLVLRVVDFYGDTLSPAPQYFRLKQLTERISGDTTHRSDTLFDTKPVELVPGGFSYTPNLEDSLTFIIGNDTIVEPPQMRIKFPGGATSPLGNAIFGLSGQEELNDNSVWLDFLAGFKIEADTLAGFGSGMMTVNPYSVYSGLKLYYRKQRKVTVDGMDSTIIDTLRLTFPVKSPATSLFPSVTVGHYTQNYSGTVVESLLNDATDDDSILPIQGMQGLKARIEVPNLDDLGTVVINKATLLLKLTGDTQGELELHPPNRMFSYTGDGLDTVVNDILLGDDHYKGTLTEITANDGSIMDAYEINLTWHFQGIVNQAFENRTLLIPFPYFRVADRVIVGGANHPDDRFKMELVITYTEIE